MLTNLEQVLLLGLPEIAILMTRFRCSRLLQLIYLQSVHYKIPMQMQVFIFGREFSAHLITLMFLFAIFRVGK